MSNWLQILIPIIIFGGGFLQWLAKKMEEERIKKRQAELRAKQEEAYLRTGRDPTQAFAQATPQQSAAASADLAALRRAQLEELQRQIAARTAARQTGQASGRAPGQPPAPGRVPPGYSVPGASAGGRLPTRAPAGPLPRPTQPQGQRGNQRQPGHPAQRPTQRPPQQRPRPQQLPQSAAGGIRPQGPRPPIPQQSAMEMVVDLLPGVAERAEQRATAPAPANRAAKHGTPIGGLTKARLRDAIILREVLDPPLALREE